MRNRAAASRSALVAAVSDTVDHFESPPPIPGQRRLTARLAERMAAAGIVGFEVAAALLRYKQWRVNSAIFREECARPIVLIRPETCDAEGFLLGGGCFTKNLRLATYTGVEHVMRLSVRMRPPGAPRAWPKPSRRARVFFDRGEAVTDAICEEVLLDR